jgi:Transposase DDE domain
MKGVKELKAELGKSLDWHGSRLDFLAKFILALFKVKTVNLVQVATAFAGRAKVDSHYNRLQRFFRGFSLDYALIAKIVTNLLPIRGEAWVLTLDRTNWKFGLVNINLLILGVAYKGIAFPVLWLFLPKQGNSNTAERIKLLEQFLGIFGLHKIAYVVADREFVGKAWFAYLRSCRIRFRIRIKQDTLLANARGLEVNAWTLFRDLKAGEVRVLSGTRRMWGCDLYAAGMKLEDGDFLIVVSSDSPTTILEDYANRWEIETLFGCLKTRGFRFEDTHLSEGERINKLVALLALAFTWAHLTGEWLAQHQPIRFKKLSSDPSKASSATGSTSSETLSSISMKSSLIFSSS